MPKKKILIINPGNLYPVRMAFQDRVVNMIRVLNKAHHVDVVVLYNTTEQRQLQEQQLPEICEKYFLIPKPNRNFLQRKVYGLLKKGVQALAGFPEEAVYSNWPSVRKKILAIINTGSYDIVQIEAWWQGGLFKDFGSNVFKVIDTHDVMYEKRELERCHGCSDLTHRDKAFLAKYKQKELENTGRADTIVSIARHDLEVFKKHFPGKNHLLIPIGRDLSDLIDYPRQDDGRTILFYGSMGSKQNILGFWRLYNSILPSIKRHIPDIRLIVLGANPPREIQQLHDGQNIIVTGFVDDVRPFIAESTIMILPLEISGGFRGRIIEVMAMGVPVLGTHNALDCTGMKSGVHGFVADSDSLLQSYTIDLLSNNDRLKSMQASCRQFVAVNYSEEKTYGKLSQYYKQL